MDPGEAFLTLAFFAISRSVLLPHPCSLGTRERKRQTSLMSFSGIEAPYGRRGSVSTSVNRCREVQSDGIAACVGGAVEGTFDSSQTAVEASHIAVSVPG